MIESRYMGNGHPTLIGILIWLYKPLLHPLLLGWWPTPFIWWKHWSLDPSTYQNHRTLGRLPPEIWSLGNQNRNPSPGPLSFTVSKTTCNNPWWSFSWWHKFPFHASQTIGKKPRVPSFLADDFPIILGLWKPSWFIVSGVQRWLHS